MTKISGSFSQVGENITEKKRERVIRKLKNLPEDDLQIIYQTLFKDEITSALKSLPEPAKKLSVKQITALLETRRGESGFYR